MKSALRELLIAFQSKRGVSRSVYRATILLVDKMYGRKSHLHLIDCIDVAGKRYYLRDSNPIVDIVEYTCSLMRELEARRV